MADLGLLDQALFRWATLAASNATIIAGLYWNRTSSKKRDDVAAEKAEADRQDVASEAAAARLAAEKAAVAVAPISNGFANDMRTGLARLEAIITDHREETRRDIADVRGIVMTHMSDHAGADVRRGKQ